MKKRKYRLWTELSHCYQYDLARSRGVLMTTSGTEQSSFYAALEVHAGRAVPSIEQRHRSRKFIGFIDQLLRAYPPGELHVILDNMSSHASRKVQEWHRRPRSQRVAFHFIPTYSSRLNLAEVLFNLLQAKVIRRGVFPSKPALATAIMNYIKKFNEEGRVSHWAKTAETIISSSNNLTGH